jgi:twitching motility protein PilI
MANREALRDLQTRLATRLQAARTEAVSASWLALRVGQLNVLFPLAQAGEIFSLPVMTPVPYARDWFLGVVNLRGSLHGVVDLAGFMHCDFVRTRTELSLAECSLVTFNADLELNCALVVDGLAGLRRQDSFVSSLAPAAGTPTYFGNQFMDSGGAQWQEINLRALSQYPEFLSIGA